MGGGMGQMSPEQRLARQKAMLFQGLTLSAEQSAKADTIILQGMRKQMEAMQAARGGGGDRAATMTQMQAMNQERNEALKALLTTDADKAKFEENLKNMPQGRRGGRGGR